MTDLENKTKRMNNTFEFLMRSLKGLKKVDQDNFSAC